MNAFIGVLIFSLAILATLACTNIHHVRSPEGVYERSLCYYGQRESASGAESVCRNANKILVKDINDAKYRNYIEKFRAANFYGLNIGWYTLLSQLNPNTCRYIVGTSNPSTRMQTQDVSCRIASTFHCEFESLFPHCAITAANNCVINRQYTIAEARAFCTRYGWTLNERFGYEDGFSRQDTRYQVPLLMFIDSNPTHPTCQYWLGSFREVEPCGTRTSSFACKMP